MPLVVARRLPSTGIVVHADRLCNPSCRSFVAPADERSQVPAPPRFDSVGDTVEVAQLGESGCLTSEQQVNETRAPIDTPGRRT